MIDEIIDKLLSVNQVLCDFNHEGSIADCDFEFMVKFSRDYREYDKIIDEIVDAMGKDKNGTIENMMFLQTATTEFAKLIGSSKDIRNDCRWIYLKKDLEEFVKLVHVLGQIATLVIQANNFGQNEK